MRTVRVGNRAVSTTPSTYSEMQAAYIMVLAFLLQLKWYYQYIYQSYACEEIYVVFYHFFLGMVQTFSPPFSLATKQHNLEVLLTVFS